MSMLHAASALAGYASNRQMEMAKEREALAEADCKAEPLLRDMEVASRLHDIVTSDLSWKPRCRWSNATSRRFGVKKSQRLLLA